MRILALTNMYPSERTPSFGIFVRHTIEAIRREDPSVEIDLLFIDGRRGKSAYLAAPLQVARRARRGYDLIHTHYGLLAGSGAFFPGPRVITLYGSDVEMPSQFRWARPFLTRYQTVVVMNEKMRDLIGRPDAAILPPGIDLERFTRRDRTEARKRLGLDPHARYILFPSSPSRPVKRFDIFTEVVERVRSERPGVGPLLLGSPERPNEEVPWVYAAADLLLLTSDSEGSPTVIKEALAMGLPIVSVDVGDVRAQLEGIGLGRVVPSRNRDHLARAVLETLDTDRRPDTRADLERLSIQRTASGYLELYAAARTDSKR